MEWGVQEWVNYFDEGGDLKKVNFDPFTKERLFLVEIFNEGETNTNDVHFKEVASLYYNAGIGDERLEIVDVKEFNWQLFEMGYFPLGVGNLINEHIKEYQANANFIVIFSNRLWLIEATQLFINEKKSSSVN